MQIKKVFLDLDGVCNRMIMHALEYVGCPGVSRYYDESYPLPGNYDMVAAANKLLGTEWTREQFWALIPRWLWGNTPPSAEFPYLLKTLVALVGGENITLLTAPTEDPDSAAGKMEWVHRFAPKFLHRQYLVGPAKAACASPDAMLIDDSDANVKEFRGAGGQAILVPRPWNSLWERPTFEYLAEELEKLGEPENPQRYKQSFPT